MGTSLTLSRECTTFVLTISPGFPPCCSCEMSTILYAVSFLLSSTSVAGNTCGIVLTISMMRFVFNRPLFAIALYALETKPMMLLHFSSAYKLGSMACAFWKSATASLYLSRYSKIVPLLKYKSGFGSLRVFSV